MTDAGPLSLVSTDRTRLRTADAAPAAASRRTTRVSRSSRASGTAVSLFSALVLLVVTCGWLLRDRIPLNPESGPGYALGAAGGATMLLLGLYSARKRLRFMRGWGPLSQWFRVHMVLGVLGPVLILFHCKFHLGALNSNVAVVSMLVVAASGVVGRYIYTRISHGLYGARATFAELHTQLDVSAHTLGDRLPPTSRTSQRLAAFAASARVPHRSIFGRLLWLVVLPLRAMLVRRRVLHDLRTDLESEAKRCGWVAPTHRANEEAIREVIRAYIPALVKEVQFSAYERLFSLWHALHVPLFVMLLLTGVMHVVAVHMY